MDSPRQENESENECDFSSDAVSAGLAVSWADEDPAWSLVARAIAVKKIEIRMDLMASIGAGSLLKSRNHYRLEPAGKVQFDPACQSVCPRRPAGARMPRALCRAGGSASSTPQKEQQSAARNAE